MYNVFNPVIAAHCGMIQGSFKQIEQNNDLKMLKNIKIIHNDVINGYCIIRNSDP